MALTPEQIARQNAARAAGGEIGELGARNTGPQATYSNTPRQGPLPRPAPAPAAPAAPPDVGRAPADPAVWDRMAAQRQARIDAFRSGGAEALDRTMNAQSTGPAAARPVAAEPVAAAQPAAASAATRGVASSASRLGAAPVQPRATSGLGRYRAAPGQGAGAAGLVALVAADSALSAANRPTDDYYNRLGMNPNIQGAPAAGAGLRNWLYNATGASTATRETGENLARFGRDFNTRVAGVASDIGADVLDQGMGIANRVRGAFGYEPLQTFGEIVRGNDRPNGGIPAAAPGTQQLPDMVVRPGDAGQQLPDMVVRPPAGYAAGAPASTGGLSPVGDIGASTPSRGSGNPNDVLGEFNGRIITRGEADSLAGRNVVSSGQLGRGVAVSMLTGGRQTPDFGELPAGRGASQQPVAGQQQILDLVNRERADRLEARSASNERIAKLYKRFDSLMGEGKRRSAAVVGDAIARELGVVGDTSRGTVPDIGARPADLAEASRLGAVAEGLQYENSRKRMADDALSTYMNAPDSPEGKAALTQYQSIMGKQYRDYKPITITAADGSQRVVSFDATTGMYVTAPDEMARSNQAQAAIAAGADPEKVRKRLQEQQR